MSENATKLTGPELIRFRDALGAAFDENELSELLLVYFNENLSAIVRPGPLKFQILDLVKWANKRSIISDLVRAAFAERPKDVALRDFQRKYGALPGVSLQIAGTLRIETPQSNVANALEGIVKPRLTLVDMNVWREQLVKIEGQVCRIERQGAPVGTGFLIGPDLVLTNFHVLEPVIQDPTLAAGVTFRFDYRRLADGTVYQGTTCGLMALNWLMDSSRYSKAEGENQPDREIPTVDELDFALVRLSCQLGTEPTGSSAATPRGWIKLPVAQPPLPNGAPIIIAQHPKGEPLKLAIDTDAVLGLNGNATRVRYATNTEPGSSGSPCFDMNWSLLALHHMGDPAWRNPQFNEGVPVGLIQERLRACLQLNKA